MSGSNASVRVPRLRSLSLITSTASSSGSSRRLGTATWPGPPATVIATSLPTSTSVPGAGSCARIVPTSSSDSSVVWTRSIPSRSASSAASATDIWVKSGRTTVPAPRSPGDRIWKTRKPTTASRAIAADPGDPDPGTGAFILVANAIDGARPRRHRPAPAPGIGIGRVRDRRWVRLRDAGRPSSDRRRRQGPRRRQRPRPRRPRRVPAAPAAAAACPVASQPSSASANEAAELQRFCRLERQRAVDDRRELSGNRRSDRPWVRGRAAESRDRHRSGAVALPGPLPREHLEEHDAQREDVAGLRGRSRRAPARG